MSNPYNTPGNPPQTPPPSPAPDRRGPRWARKRFVLPAIGLAFVIGLAMSGGGREDGKDPVSADPRPTATVTATATATVTATATATETATPEPAATVTVRATRTVTAEPAVDADTGSDGGSDGGSGTDGGSGGGDVYYQNCAAARAAGAAPVHVGDPGYAPHLDRDGDGVGCE